MRHLEKSLAKKLKKELPNFSDITPGLMIEVHRKGELECHLRYGETYRYYDIASLTKIIFSATAWMRWISQSSFDVTLPVYYFLPWWHHRETTVQNLLTHSGGLKWWRPYYRMLKGPVHFEERWPQLAKLVAKGRPHPTGKAVYSDLDLYVLGYVLEELKQSPLPDIWSEIQSDFGLEQTRFHLGNHPPHARHFYAPTETCPWRERSLQGEVHDENTWALGGVAPHAGLFSTVHDVSKWALTLRRALRGGVTPFGRSDIVQEFTKRQLPRNQGDWGYLFMKPALKNASCGRFFSKRSFGHTGFTGTSLWMDPIQDLIVVILSNRVHPTRENKTFLKLRPRLHEWVCELI